MRSKVSQRISPGIKDIALYIHPESYKKIDDHRGTQGHKGHIDKILADGGCGNAHLFPNGRTYAKYMPFNKMLKAVHTAKLNRF